MHDGIPVENKNNSQPENTNRVVNSENMSLWEIEEQTQKRYRTPTFITFLIVFKNHWRRIIGIRFFTMMFISAVWTSFVWFMLETFLIEIPLFIIGGLFFLPVTVSGIITNRAHLSKRLTVNREYVICERIKSDRRITRYIDGDRADCNCIHCRWVKMRIRKLITKYYLKGYCLRCKTKVNMLNPRQVFFINGREAVAGIYPICRFKVVRIGKFYGKNLFEQPSTHPQTLLT